VRIYFITGASGSGKTAIIPHLKQIVSDVVIYDFDDIGVPTDADKKWRQASTEQWLKNLAHETKDVCLLGQMVLGEILACPSAAKLGTVNFCLLDVSDYERIVRLKKRNTGQADQNMLNWSSWLRMHTRDPQWAQQVLKEDGWQGLDFSAWDKLAIWDGLARIKTLDTTNLSIHNVAECIADWVNNKNEWII